MGKNIDKVKEKADYAKDKVKWSTEDIMSSPPPSSPQSSSSFNDQEKNYKESVTDLETRSIEAPLMKHIGEERLIPLEIKKQELATASAASAAAASAAAASATNTNADENIDKVDKNDNYKESNELINPFVIGFEIWQNYSAFWMEYCKDMINNNAKMIKDFGDANEKSWKHATKPKGFKVKAE